MHKYFAKPLFLGKKVEFLPECHSTNEELTKRYKNNDISEGHLIYTDHQAKGKGQRGNVWLSEHGKNLLFSFFITPLFLFPRQSFLLNLITGLAIVKVLKMIIHNKNVALKWPNDVYIADRKVAGVLIETTIESDMLSGAVIGVGLNVNQDFFHLPSATSVKIETGKTLDRESLLESFLVSFEDYYITLKSHEYERIQEEYYSVMRWRGEQHVFRAGGVQFPGEILGIDEGGRLLLNANNQIKRFDVKDIEFLY